MIPDLRKTYYTRKIEESKGDLKSTWEILKHAMNRGNKASTVIDTVFVEGQELTDKKNKFQKHSITILLTLEISFQVQLSELIHVPLTILLKQMEGSVSSTFNQPKFLGYCQNLKMAKL